MRWIIRYVPEFEKRWNRLAEVINSSWRVDETYIKISGRWNYLFRAVDKHGKTINFHLRRTRGTAAAEAFFRKALCTTGHHWPKKVTRNGHKPSHLALRYLRREDPKRVKVKVRSSQYLNNVVEQDHRVIKRRCACLLGFKSFVNASIVLAGIELANRIRKHQFGLGKGRRSWSLRLNELWRRALAC